MSTMKCCGLKRRWTVAGVLFFSFACAFSLPCKVSFAKRIQFLGDLWSPDKGRKRRVLVLN